MKTWFSLAAVMVGAIGLLGPTSGCHDAPPYTEARLDNRIPPEVQLTGPKRDELQDQIVVDRPRTSRDAGGLLKVTVPVRAIGSKVLIMQYHPVFLDAQGQALPGMEEAWFTVQVEPGAQRLITFNSTSPRAEQFQMQLRWAR